MAFTRWGVGVEKTCATLKQGHELELAAEAQGAGESCGCT